MPHLTSEVELLVKKPGLKEAMANQLVYLRSDGEDILVDGRTIPELDRIEIGGGILGSLVWNLAQKRIARDLREFLSWFRHFSSIPACIDRIESGESNFGKGEAATRVLQLLRNRQAPGRKD